MDPVVKHVSCTIDLQGDLIIHDARVELAGNNTLHAIDECSKRTVSVQAGRKFADGSLNFA